MSRYRIVCTEQTPGYNQPANARIVAVGVSSGGGTNAEARWTVAEVLAAMDADHQFYTKGLNSGRVAEVISYWDYTLGRRHIKSAADAVQDNNLDSLRYCQWKAA